MSTSTEYEGDERLRLLPGRFEAVRFLDLATGLPWVVPRLFMVGDLVTVGSGRLAPLVHDLAAFWAVSISRDRPVLYITSYPSQLMGWLSRMAKHDGLALDEFRRTLQLVVNPDARNGGENWGIVRDVVLKTAARLVVVVREQGPHSEADIEGYEDLTALGAAVVVAMSQVDSALADAADVCLSVEQYIGGGATICVAKGHKEARDLRYGVVDHIYVPETK